MQYRSLLWHLTRRKGTSRRQLGPFSSKAICSVNLRVVRNMTRRSQRLIKIPSLTPGRQTRACFQRAIRCTQKRSVRVRYRLKTEFSTVLMTVCRTRSWHRLSMMPKKMRKTSQRRISPRIKKAIPKKRMRVNPKPPSAKITTKSSKKTRLQARVNSVKTPINSKRRSNQHSTG